MLHICSYCYGSAIPVSSVLCSKTPLRSFSCSSNTLNLQIKCVLLGRIIYRYLFTRCTLTARCTRSLIYRYVWYVAEYIRTIGSCILLHRHKWLVA